MPQHNRLEAVFPAEPQVLLEPRQTSAVLDRSRGAALGPLAHSAVSKPEQSNHDELPSDRPGSAPQPAYQGPPQHPYSLEQGCAPVIGARTYLFSEEVLSEQFLVDGPIRAVASVTRVVVRTVIPSAPRWPASRRGPTFERQPNAM